MSYFFQFTGKILKKLIASFYQPEDRFVTFAYPNVNPYNEFSDIGTMTAFNKTAVDQKKFEIACPNFSGMADIESVSSVLTSKSSKSTWNVYEKNGDSRSYVGDSMGLAFLLAKINCSMQVKKKYLDQSIWCTGQPALKGNVPFLSDVSPNEFDIKLKAFIADSESKLFLIPKANMNPVLTDLCYNKKIRLITPHKLLRTTLTKYKTVVLVNGNELTKLVNVIFKMSWEQSAKKAVFTLFYISIALFFIVNLFWYNSQIKSTYRKYCTQIMDYFIKKEIRPDIIIDGMTFLWIPGGCYEMGCNTSTGYDCSTFESYMHTVCVKGFWMGKTEISQKNWLDVMGYNPSTFQTGNLNLPVESVSWLEIDKFINILNSRPETKYSFRLPSEAEWEFACTDCGSKTISKKIESSGTTYPVCKYNHSGLCDMTGNVLEMCSDTFQKGAYENHSLNNPVIQMSGSDIVLRGADFSMPENFSPCRHRSYAHKNESTSNIGFRLILEEK